MSASVHARIHPPPEQTPPRSRHTPQSRHAPWSKHAPPEQTHPPEPGTPPGTKYTPPSEHAVRYGQRAGGTHPTGMQSCSILLLSLICSNGQYFFHLFNTKASRKNSFLYTCFLKYFCYSLTQKNPLTSSKI